MKSSALTVHLNVVQDADTGNSQTGQIKHQTDLKIFGNVVLAKSALNVLSHSGLGSDPILS